MRAVVQNPSPLQRIHDVGAADQRRDRQPLAECLAECHQVRGEFVVFLTAARGNTKASNGFIKNEHDSMRLSEFLKACEISIGGRDHAHVGHNTFGDDGGDLAAMIFERALKRGKIIPWHNNRVVKSVLFSPELSGIFTGSLRRPRAVGGSTFELMSKSSCHPW